MSTRRGGLGRGLGALIPTGPPQSAVAPPEAAERSHLSGTSTTGATPGTAGAAHDASTVDRPAREAAETDGATAGRGDADQAGIMAVPGARFAEIAVSAVRPNAKQPRQVFDETALDELAHSLREVGFLQPIVVREIAGGYELVMGERRWRAAQQAGLTEIPAIIRETGDDAMLRDALLENLHREQLNALEEGAAYAQLLEEFGVTHDELAKRIGRSRSQVSNTIRLLNLPASVQRRVAAGVLTAGHARALLALEDPPAQESLAQRIVAEGLSVRAVEELVAVGPDAAHRRRSPRAPRHRAPALDELATGLSDHFETRVRVDLGRTRGKITVEFASVDDLERIVAAMAPDVVAAIAPGVAASRSEGPSTAG